MVVKPTARMMILLLFYVGQANTTRENAIQCTAVKYHAVQCSAMGCGATECNPMPHSYLTRVCVLRSCAQAQLFGFME